MMTADDEDDDNEYSFQIHWEGPGDLRVVFEEDESGGKYRGNLYLAANWSSDGKVIGWEPVYTSPTSRAKEAETGATFAWDGEGGVFHFDGREIVLRRDEQPAKEAPATA